ncbi:putative immunity protein [Microbacterium sp. NPDC057944]|uniref:putative immunity protein n=1 Tax=Microbacterium sp. NPDC057944 TaxID=3346286 RepID=UPI0036D99C56
MLSPQSLSETDRRLVAAWAADCAERVLSSFENDAPGDDRPRDAIARARAYARGDLDSAGEIRRRFVAGRAAASVSAPGAIAAARAAAQASGVAHMGAHALGAAAYAVKAVSIDRPDGVAAEIDWQVAHMSADVRAALLLLPPVGEDSAGPLVAGGLLARGILGTTIRALQDRIAAGPP